MLHYNDYKMFMGSFELPHKGFGLEWREKFSTYVMLMLVGFRDSVMTSMITKPIPIPGPPRKHCSYVLKLDTVSIGFSFSWLGLME